MVNACASTKVRTVPDTHKAFCIQVSTATATAAAPRAGTAGTPAAKSAVTPKGTLGEGFAIDAYCEAHPYQWWVYRDTGCIDRYVGLAIRDADTGEFVGHVGFEIFENVDVLSSSTLSSEDVRVDETSADGVGVTADYEIELDCKGDCDVLAAGDVEKEPVEVPTDATWDMNSNISSSNAIGFEHNELTLTVEALDTVPIDLEFDGPDARCDSMERATMLPGCVFPQYTPTAVWSTSGPYAEVAQHVGQAQTAGLPGAPGGTALHRLTISDYISKNSDKACPSSFPKLSSQQCDQYPFASTWEGAFTGDGRYSAVAVDSPQSTASDNELATFYADNRVIEDDPFWVMSTSSTSILGGPAAFQGGDRGIGGGGSGTTSWGAVHQIFGDAAGWHDGSTQTALPTGSPISALSMGGAWPQILTNESGRLHQIYGDTSGWHDVSTGLAISSGAAVSAVNMGAAWPQVITVEGGKIHQISGDSSGWHDGSTGITVPSGTTISALNVGAAWPQIMANENGTLHQIYGDTAGWHDASTGRAIPAGAKISAVNMGAAWPQVMVIESGTIHQIYGDSTGWHDSSTGITVPSATTISAVRMGGQWPQVMANENGQLHQISGDTTGWHDGSTTMTMPSGVGISAVNMGGAWPQIMTIE